MKKVVSFLALCFVLIALVISGSKILRLQTSAKLKAAIAQVELKSFPEKIEDFLPTPEENNNVSSPDPKIKAQAEPPQTSVEEFLFNQHNKLNFRLDEVFRLQDHLCAWTPHEEEEVMSLQGVNAGVLSDLKALLPQSRANVQSLYQRTGFDQNYDFSAFNGRRWVAAFSLLQFEACFTYREGRYDEALQTYLLLLKLDRHLRGFPLHGNLLLYLWSVDPYLPALILLEGHFSEEMVQSFKAALNESTGSDDFVRGVKEEMFLIRKELGHPDLIMKQLKDASALRYMLGLAYASPLCDFKRDMDETLFLEMCSRELEFLGKPYYQNCGLLKNYISTFSTVGLDKPPLLRYHAQEMKQNICGLSEFEVYLTQMNIALALNRYHEKSGMYPDELQPLVPEYLPKIPSDPFSGKSMYYRRLQEDYVIFSAGENGIYDLKTQGEETSKQVIAGGSSVWGKGDIVWGLETGSKGWSAD